MPVSLEQFVTQLAESGLLSLEEIGDLQARLPADKLGPGDARPFAMELVRRQKLTSYQAAHALQGKAQGLVFGKYIVLEKIGQGGMGLVYKAEHRRMNRVVALKVMSPVAMRSPEAVKRFRREVEAAARLTHPNIVAAYDANEARGVHFLVMEYVEGRDLALVIKQDGPLPIDKGVRCILQAARGLEHAHREGVVHRDIKPSNLLIDNSGTVKILDMGLARLTDSGIDHATSALTQSGRIMGTVDYMSPEQALHTRYADRPADIYSLGCSLYYLLTGRPVYSGESLMEKMLAHRERPIPSLSAAREGMPPEWDRVFCKMLAKKIEDRYASMTDVIRDLEACLAGKVAPVSAPSAGEARLMPPPAPGVVKPGVNNDDSQNRVNTMRPSASTTNANTDAVTTPALDVLAGRLGEPISVPAGSARRQPRQISRGRAGLIGGMAVVLVALTGWVLSTQRAPGRLSASSPARSRNDPPSLPAADRRGGPSGEGATGAKPVDPDRSAAEWALRQGGEIELQIDDERQLFRAPAKLPAGAVRLTGVNLAGCDFFSTDLGKLARLSALESLNLAGNWNFNSRVSDDDLVHIGGLTTLEKFDLSFSAVTTEGLAHLRHLVNLRELYFYMCPNVRDDGVAHLSELTQLVTLHLGGTKVTDEGLEAVGKMTELTSMLLDGSPIRGRGLVHLASARNLDWLHLANDPLDDDEFEVVTRLSVKTLSLTNTALTDRSVRYLKTLKNVKQMHIGGTRITESGEAELKAALPNCQIGR
ncbi:MAG TPA: protein kinase [Planctomycetaceae bacterium]|nr:protein kinase [Planctomycetaceae bacterium]